MAKETDIVLNHNYDGIQEYDNPLPNWWLMIFYATIVFSGAYYFYYEMAGGPTLKQELKVAIDEIQETQKRNAPPEPAAETEESLKAIFAKADLASGATVYTSRCAVCHGPELQGQIGPNLTDAYWINTKGTHAGMVATIRIGVAEKGMPPWESILKPDEVYNVAAYIYSKKGSNPPNPKAPQGDEFRD